jgi:hypothetical protein
MYTTFDRYEPCIDGEKTSEKQNAVCSIRCDPISMATNMYSTRKVAVTDTKKPPPATPFAW